jgi:hypothetical protein
MMKGTFIIIEENDIATIKYVMDCIKIKYDGDYLFVKIINSNYIFYNNKATNAKSAVDNFSVYLKKYGMMISASSLESDILSKIEKVYSNHNFMLIPELDINLKFYFELDGFLPKYKVIGYDTVRDIGTDHDFAMLRFYICDEDNKIVDFKLSLDYDFVCIGGGGDYQIEDCDSNYVFNWQM